MPSSLIEMFPGVDPSQCVAIPQSAIITGTLTNGNFIFDPSVKIKLHNAYKGVMYYVAGLQMSADTDALSFSAALNAPIMLSIWRKNNAQRANQTDIPFSAFNEFFPLQTWYESQNFNGSEASDEIQLSASGSVKQTPALADKLTLRLFVTLMIYQINNQAFITRFRGN